MKPLPKVKLVFTNGVHRVSRDTILATLRRAGLFRLDVQVQNKLANGVELTFDNDTSRSFDLIFVICGTHITQQESTLIAYVLTKKDWQQWILDHGRVYRERFRSKFQMHADYFTTADRERKEKFVRDFLLRFTLSKQRQHQY